MTRMRAPWGASLEDMATDRIELTVPADPRYLDVAVAAMEALADRAGVAATDLPGLRDAIHTALEQRLDDSQPREHVHLSYEVGDGFLGVRVRDDRTEPASGTTSSAQWVPPLSRCATRSTVAPGSP